MTAAITSNYFEVTVIRKHSIRKPIRKGPAPPKIGIFWHYRGALLVYSRAVSEVAESAGFIDVDMSHYAYWRTFQIADPELEILEYEEVPRGRVLYDAGKKLYKVYSSTRLIENQTIRELVLKTFCLPASGTVFESDLHYEPPESIDWIRHL